MALEKMSFVETNWYQTQEGTAQAKDFIFKDFCDYIIVIKTFADKEDSSKLIRTEVVHIDSNHGGVNHKKISELDPPLLEALDKSGFPVVKD
jgi:predicted RNase H-related nuclease YkuK (DUF458 family)